MKKLERAFARLGIEAAPISLPNPRLPRTNASKSGLQRWLVFGDTHFPLADPDVLSIVLQVARDWAPHGVVMNGDIPDMNAIKQHPPDLSENWGLKEERVEMQKFIHQLHEVVPRDAQILETNANHSGRGPESRWRRYLSLRIPELTTMPDLMAALDYAAVFHPQEDWCRVRLVDHVTICKGLIAIHGEFVRPKAAYSARAMLEKYRVNLIHGHTHRMGATGYRVPGIGNQQEHQMRAFEGGCCLKLDPQYTRAPDWQQGLSLVSCTPTGSFAIEQVLVHKGEAVVTTLGAVYKA